MEMKLITDIQIDLYGETKYYLVSAKQGDKNTRYIRIQLMNNGVEYVIPTDMITVANVKKPDGKYCYNECEVKDNRIIVQLTNQMLAASGTAYCDVEIKDINGNLILSSEAFTVEIEPSMRNESAILSSNEMGVLDATMKRYHEAEMEREAAETERKKKEGERKENEEERVAAEENREQKETERQTAESLRHAAEETRRQNENRRIQNENTRIENETGRNSAETVRQQQLQEMIEATKAAKEATEAISNVVIGVKGDAEEKYQTGLVNIRPEDIGGFVPGESIDKDYYFTTTGWTRVAKFELDNSLNTLVDNNKMWNMMLSCLISIRRWYNNDTPEYHLINLATSVTPSHPMHFTVLSQTGKLIITQARVVWVSSEHTFYLDFYYTGTKRNFTYIQITNNFASPMATANDKFRWKMIDAIHNATSGEVVGSQVFPTTDFFCDNYALPLMGGTVTGQVDITALLTVSQFRNHGYGRIDGNLDVMGSIYPHKYLNIMPWEGYENDAASYNNGTKLWYDAKERKIKTDSGGAVYIDLTATFTQYFRPVEIPTNANLNSYMSAGTYRCPANSTVATLSNCPTANAFSLLVLSHAGTMQLLIEYVTASPKWYTRNYYNGAWGRWRLALVLDANDYLQLPSYLNYPVVEEGGLCGAASQFLYANADNYIRKITRNTLRDVVFKMTGATASENGIGGTVPAPVAGAANRYLRSDGTWQVPPDSNTTYSAATQSAAGLMSAADKTKLDALGWTSTAGFTMGLINVNSNAIASTSGGLHVKTGGGALYLRPFDTYGACYVLVKDTSNLGRLYANLIGLDTAVGSGKSKFINYGNTPSGNVNVYMPLSSGTINVTSSDVRLKENIEDTKKEALPVVNQIKIRQFDWKDGRGHQEIGVVADELEELDERFVLAGTGGYDKERTDDDGNTVINPKCVDTFYMQGYLIKAIQELHDIVKEQVKEISDLKRQIESIQDLKK